MKRRKKRYINRKGRSVLVFIIWSYIGKILDSIKTLLELINNFSKVAGYKINIQKSESFPYKNNTWKRKKPNSLTRALEAMKYLGINLAKEVKSWNCKMLMKETEDDTNKWKHTCSSFRRVNIIKMSILQSQIQCNLYQDSNCIFHGNKKNLKICNGTMQDPD